MKMTEKIRYTVLLLCFLLLAQDLTAAAGASAGTQAATGSAAAQAQAEDNSSAEDAVALASRHKVSGGRFSGNKKGIRYIYKDKHYEINTWARIGNSVYRFDEAGYVKRGAFTLNGKSYRADRKGVLYINKVYTHRSKKYYYGRDGVMVRSAWVTIGGADYYFGSNGSMARNCWAGEYHVGSSGRKDRNCVVGKYYLGPDGKRTLISEIGKRYNDQRLIIIGASRVVQMAQDVSGDTDVMYFASSGQGYSWFKNTVCSKLRDALKVWPRSIVVIQMGNNDIDKGNSHLKDYIKLYKNLIRQYPKASFFFMDALPSKGRTPMNEKRKAFNKKLKAAFPSRYIGGFDYLVRNGFSQRSKKDAAHYDAATNRRIFSYILSKTGWKS
ncbi:MAG: hypothetical protein K6C06_01330 [Lachnospiraceae bacterium]|nr:hypothetical protein [Lachnospiraceae bacterium]